jgi:hypothetical protein
MRELFRGILSLTPGSAGGNLKTLKKLEVLPRRKMKQRSALGPLQNQHSAEWLRVPKHAKFDSHEELYPPQRF